MTHRSAWFDDECRRKRARKPRRSGWSGVAESYVRKCQVTSHMEQLYLGENLRRCSPQSRRARVGARRATVLHRQLTRGGGTRHEDGRCSTSQQEHSPSSPADYTRSQTPAGPPSRPCPRGHPDRRSTTSTSRCCGGPPAARRRAARPSRNRSRSGSASRGTLGPAAAAPHTVREEEEDRDLRPRSRAAAAAKAAGRATAEVELRAPSSRRRYHDAKTGCRDGVLPGGCGVTAIEDVHRVATRL